MGLPSRRRKRLRGHLGLRSVKTPGRARDADFTGRFDHPVGGTSPSFGGVRYLVSALVGDRGYPTGVSRTAPPADAGGVFHRSDPLSAHTPAVCLGADA